MSIKEWKEGREEEDMSVATSGEMIIVMSLLFGLLGAMVYSHFIYGHAGITTLQENYKELAKIGGAIWIGYMVIGVVLSKVCHAVARKFDHDKTWSRTNRSWTAALWWLVVPCLFIYFLFLMLGRRI